MASYLDQLSQDQDHQNTWSMPRQDSSLQDLAGQQQMTHQPQQSSPELMNLAQRGRQFLDYAQQPVQSQAPPWQERINQALIRQDPRYVPQPLPQQQNWQHWIEEALGFAPLLGGTIKLVEPPATGGYQPFSPWKGQRFNLIHQETGENRGDVWLNYNPETKNLTLEYGMTRGGGPGSGPSQRDRRQWGLGGNPGNPLEAMLEIKSALPEAFRLFPDMKTVDLTSIGGARGTYGVGADLKYEVSQTPEGIVWKRIKDPSKKPSRLSGRSPPTPPAAGPSTRPIAPPPPLPTSGPIPRPPPIPRRGDQS